MARETKAKAIERLEAELRDAREENRKLRADLAGERARAVALAETHVALKAEHERSVAKRTELGLALVRLQEDIRHLRADLADAKGAAAGAREDAERFRAERDALRAESAAADEDARIVADVDAALALLDSARVPVRGQTIALALAFLATREET